MKCELPREQSVGRKRVSASLGAKIWKSTNVSLRRSRQRENQGLFVDKRLKRSAPRSWIKIGC